LKKRLKLYAYSIILLSKIKRIFIATVKKNQRSKRKLIMANKINEKILNGISAKFQVYNS